MARYYREGRYDPHLHAGKALTARDRLYLAARNILLARKIPVVLSGTTQSAGSCRVLEVGCSTGDLLARLHRKNRIPRENLAGIETDEEAAAAAEKAAGIRISRTGIGALERGKTFDRIVFWHVLEHLHDLHGTLAEAVARLDRNGLMVVALPNPECRDARRYREHWVAWDAPRHLWHFTPSTLGALLRLHGLEITATAPWLPDTLYTCWYSQRMEAAAGNRRFGLRDACTALLQAAACLATTLLRPASASTLVYYVRKAS
jgi:SAM-dependent methyltransferase